MTSIEKLKKAIIDSKLYKEYKKYKDIIIKENMQDKIDELSHCAKEMTMAKNFGLDETYLDYKKKYDSIYNELESNYVFVTFLNLQDELKQLFDEMFSYISNNI